MFKKHNYLIKFISLVTLTSFLILASGCTKIADIPLEKYQKGKIYSVILLTTIYGVKLTNGTEVYYEKKTGFYDSQSREMTGITKEGDTVSNSYNQIDQVILNDYSQNIPIVRSIDFSLFLKEVDKNIWGEIDGVSARIGDLLEFDTNGGMIDSVNQKMVGYSKQGKYVEVPLEDIKYIRSDKTNWFKTGLLLIPAGLVITIVILIISPLDGGGSFFN